MMGQDTVLHGNPFLRQLLEAFFVKDEAFVKAFRTSSAAKTVHHGFVGGLLEHTIAGPPEN